MRRERADEHFSTAVSVLKTFHTDSESAKWVQDVFSTKLGASEMNLRGCGVPATTSALEPRVKDGAAEALMRRLAGGPRTATHLITGRAF